jgi:predicted dehydrogenase
LPEADSNPQKRVGVAGIGPAGLQHARAVIAAGHTVAIAAAARADSPNAAAFLKATPGVRMVQGLDALLADGSVDALVIALPWSETPRQLPRLLADPRPMLIEKPIGLAAADIEKALPGSSSVLANKMIGFNRRFYSTVDRMRRRLAEGGLRAVRVTISEDLERQTRAHGTRIVPHLLPFSSAHTLDLVLHLLGPLEIVSLRGHREASAPFTSMNGLLETREGVPVLMTLNASDPSPAGMSFIFDDHTTWNLSPLESLAVFDRYDVAELRPGSQIRRYVPHVRDFTDESAEFKPGFVAQMTAFLSGRYGPCCTVGESLLLQQFIESMLAATAAR